MPTPSLPSAVSIVDYLNSQKQDSSFSARSKLYKDAGLDKTLGTFTGAPNQNTNLLSYLQKNSAPKTTATNALAGYGMSVNPAPAPKSSSLFPGLNGYQAPTNPLTSLFKGFMPKTTTPTSNIPPTIAAPKPTPTTSALAPNALNMLGYPQIGTPPSSLSIVQGSTPPASNTPAKPPAEQPPEVNPNKDYYQQKDDQTKDNTGGVSGSTILPDANINDPNSGSEIDAVNTWLNSSEGQAFLNRQEIKNSNEVAKADATKAALEEKFAADKSTLEQKLAENGLTFSGVRATQVKALADSLASSLLETDRETASKLLLANQDLADAVLKGVADLAKQAADGRKEAIQQLNAIGYAVIGGKLVPTLAARSAERADVAQQISMARLDLAEEAAARAEARFEQQYGTGKKDQFSYVRELMDLNPNATRAELKAAALENTSLSDTEINSVLDTIGLSPLQSSETAKALVGNLFDTTVFNVDATDLKEAKEAAKRQLRATGGVIKIGGRTVALTVDQLSDMEAYIDTVTLEEAQATKDLLDNQEK